MKRNADRDDHKNDEVRSCLDGFIGAATAAVHFLNIDKGNRHRAVGALTILRSCIGPTARVSREAANKLKWECMLLELERFALHNEPQRLLDIVGRQRFPPDGTRLQHMYVNIVIARTAIKCHDHGMAVRSISKGIRASLHGGEGLCDVIPFLDIAESIAKDHRATGLKRSLISLAHTVMAARQFETIWRKSRSRAILTLKRLIQSKQTDASVGL